MIVNKSIFESKGLKCDRYAKFMLDFKEDYGNHHVYPQSIFKNESLVYLNQADHSRAHLLLALDNLDVESDESAKIMMGVIIRYNYNCEFYEDDLKLLLDNYSRIKYIASLYISRTSSERFNDEDYYNICTANLIRDSELCSKLGKERCKDPKWLEFLDSVSPFHNSEFQKEMSNRHWSREESHINQSNLMTSLNYDKEFQNIRSLKLRLNKYIYDLLDMADRNAEFEMYEFSYNHPHIYYRSNEVEYRWKLLFEYYWQFLIYLGLSKTVIDEEVNKYNLDLRNEDIRIYWLNNEQLNKLKSYFNKINKRADNTVY